MRFEGIIVCSSNMQLTDVPFVVISMMLRDRRILKED